MKNKLILIFELFLFILISSIVSAIQCNSCSDCTAKLNGDYDEVLLTTDIINAGGTCITFNANDVVFDCQDNMIDGTGTGSGIYVNNREYITIKNCIVTDFDDGIALWGASGKNILTNNTANNNSGYGISLYRYSNSNTLVGNTANYNSYDSWKAAGIHLESGFNILIENTANKNSGDGIKLRGAYQAEATCPPGANSVGNVLIDNTANNNAYDGISLIGSSDNTLEGNTANNNALDGIDMDSVKCTDAFGWYRYYSYYNTLTSNIVNNNGDNGIHLVYSASSNTLTNNTIKNNRDYGIYVSYSYSNDIWDNYIYDTGIGYTRSKNNNYCVNSIPNHYYDGAVGPTCYCYPPIDGMVIIETTKLCSETYTLPNGIDIYEESITLDCNGATLIGNGSENGIHSKYSDNPNIKSGINITIKNCNIENYNYGIKLSHSINSTIANNTASNNAWHGIRLEYSSDNILTGNTANDNIDGISLYDSDNNIFTDNTANDNDQGGFGLWYSNYNILASNKANSNGFGIYLMSSNNNQVTNNKMNNNIQYGLYLGANSDFNDLINNKITDNYDTGVYFSSDSNNNNLIENLICWNKVDVNDSDANSGDENTCNTTNNWNDIETTRCTYSCPSAFVIINISLTKGWNLISIPLNLTNNTLTEAFKSIEGNYSHLFVYGGGKWYSYYANESPTNKSVEPKIGFWINMTNDDILELEGIEWNYQISPKNGWNLVGYPYLEEEDVSELFENASVYSYNGSWSSYIPGRTFNSLTTLKPGYGYWVKSS